MDKHQRHFEQRLQDLSRFQEENKRWPSVMSADHMERSLGEWCHKLRLAYNKGKLEAYKFEALSAIGFSLRVKEDKWKSNFEKLRAYLGEHKCLPPVKHPLYPYTNSQYKRFELLPPGQKEKLQSINFLTYCASRSSSQIWKRNFDRLNSFFQTHGVLPTRKVDYSLECWVNAQRQHLKKGLLTEEQVKCFEEAGIDLLKRSFRKESDGWEKKSRSLAEFYQKLGRAPNLKVASEASLAKWLFQQAILFKNKSLAAGRMTELARILNSDPCQVFHEVLAQKFDLEFKELEAFYITNKRWPQAKFATSKLERRLVKWCTEMRNDFRGKKLDAPQVTALEDIGFPFDPQEDRRTSGFAELRAHLESSGGTLQRLDPLYRFYTQQKKAYETLEPRDRALLDSIIIVRISSSSRYIFDWEERFAKVLHFIHENKKLPSPKDDEDLSKWWAAIRKKMIEGKLSQLQVSQLQKSGIVFKRRIDAWEDQFGKLKEFVQETKRWPGTSHPDEKDLRSWCYLQRYKARKGELPENAVAKLKLINFPLMNKEKSKKLL